VVVFRNILLGDDAKIALAPWSTPGSQCIVETLHGVDAFLLLFRVLRGLCAHHWDCGAEHSDDSGGNGFRIIH
jgi:hypothetical protein